LGLSGNRQESITFVGIDTDAVVIRQIFDVLPYPDVLMKKWKIGTNVENVPISGEELIF